MAVCRKTAADFHGDLLENKFKSLKLEVTKSKITVTKAI